MVNKTKYRGVHSGNTLRSFGSCFSRHYHRQAFLISQARPELLRKLQIEKTNVGNGVPLSLNKKSRWLLPTALIQQIENDDIALPGLTVSLLQRHKLKRFANCVSFHSNRGQVKCLQPKKGRYCSFNFPRWNGKSRRSVVRENREKQRKGEGKLRGRVVEVHTEQGLATMEVRHEVYYPSPATSSISYNPKYVTHNTTATSTQPPLGAHHVQHGRPKNQHCGKQRKRFSVKDFNDVCLSTYHNQGLTTFMDDFDDEEEELTALSDYTAREQSTECFLGALIEKAERLQRTVRGVRSRHRKKSGSSINSQHEDNKSHIVYLDHDDSPRVSDSPSSEKEHVSSIPSSTPSVSVLPPEARALLLASDVSTASLSELFGQNYLEVPCIPRKFVLDITSNVSELLKKRGTYKQTQNMAGALTYLIFIQDELNYGDCAAFQVLLNSRLHPGLLPVTFPANNRGCVDEMTPSTLVTQTVDFVDNFVADMLERNRSAFTYFFTPGLPDRRLKSHLGCVETYMPSVQRLFHQAFKTSNLPGHCVPVVQTQPASFCDICYDDVCTQNKNCIPSTALTVCQHSVCDSCWAQHVHSRLHQGFTRVTCPGFDCQEEVGVALLLSVVPLDVVDKLLQRQEELRISASMTEKWCPNRKCQRVISLHTSPVCPESQLQQDVICECGAHVCFRCLRSAHWPASCTQAKDYHSNTFLFPDRLAEVHEDTVGMEMGEDTLRIEGKHCPKCNRFVFKNGGCPQMTCMCGQPFCWMCTQPGYAHYDGSCVDHKSQQKLITTIIVRHVEADESKREKQQKVKKRQRVSLMEKACDHHRHRLQGCAPPIIHSLAKAAAKAAAKNKTLAQLITQACQTSSSMAEGGSDVAEKPGFVFEMVTEFLKNVCKCKQELHEVVEYSLVFLNHQPDSLLRRRALRICEDLEAFASFTQSSFDAWKVNMAKASCPLQEAVKSLSRLAEIQRWIQSAIAAHVVTFTKIRQQTTSQ